MTTLILIAALWAMEITGANHVLAHEVQVFQPPKFDDGRAENKNSGHYNFGESSVYASGSENAVFPEWGRNRLCSFTRHKDTKGKLMVQYADEIECVPEKLGTFRYLLPCGTVAVVEADTGELLYVPVNSIVFARREVK